MIIFDKMQVHYEYLPSLNKSKGNIILLHTIGKSLQEFNNLIPYFQSEYNILRYDLLGHGQSELPSKFLSLDLLVRQLAFMANHFMKKDFYLIANPASGYVASRFCRDYGERISGIILLSPPPVYLPLHARQDIVNQMKKHAASSFEDYKQFIISNSTVKIDNGSLLTLKAQFEQTSERAYFEFMNAYLTEDLIGDFKDIRIPILVLAGAQDTLFSPSIHGVTANIIGAQFCIIPNASSMVHFDNLESTVTAIYRFTGDYNDTPAEKGFQLNQAEIQNALFKGFGYVDTTPTLSVKLINLFEVQIGEKKITKGWNLRKAKSLFLYLLFHQTCTREELIDTFWPEQEISKARNYLRTCLHHLKSMLHLNEDLEFIQTDRAHVFLKGNIHCDALEYIKDLEEAYMQVDSEDRLECAQRLLEIEPYKLVTHLHDDWYLHFRSTIEEQYYTLCKWVAEELRSVGRMEDAYKYEKKIFGLQG